MIRRALTTAVALATILAAAACAGGPTSRSRAAATRVSSPARMYVAIGASETRGVGTDNHLRQAWPQDLFRALPAGYTLVNFGIDGATVADALAQELPLARTLHPALATVWLNVNDLLSGVSSARYRAQLLSLIGALRSTGATVLVANTPPLDRLPAYLACVDPAHYPGGCPGAVPRPVPTPQQVNAAVDGYNAVIASVVSQTGAVLVDLHAAGLAARARGAEPSLISGDGFHPNSAGAQLVADQFLAALNRAGGAGAHP